MIRERFGGSTAEEHNWLSSGVSALFEVKAVAGIGAKVDGFGTA